MQTRIAVLTVFASALFLTLPDVASASYGTTSAPNSSVRITDVGAEPVNRLAQNTNAPRQPTARAAAPVNSTRPNKKAGPLKVEFKEVLVSGARKPNQNSANGSRTVTDKAKIEREREQARQAKIKRSLAPTGAGSRRGTSTTGPTAVPINNPQQ